MDNEKLTINKKQLKEIAQEHGLRIGGESYEAANDYLLNGLKRAGKRAELNQRQTIYSRDW
jgi:hypothetical protein